MLTFPQQPAVSPGVVRRSALLIALFAVGGLASCGNEEDPPTPPTAIAVITSPTLQAQNGVPFPRQPVIQLRDADGGDLKRHGVRVTATLNGISGTLGGTTMVTSDADGRATFTDLAITGEGIYTLRFESGAVAPLNSAPITVATGLENNGIVPAVGGGAGSARLFTITIPAGTGALVVRTTGGGGDADLFVRLGVLPTAQTHDCASTGPTAEERCVISTPTAGVWYVVVQGYTAYSGVALTAFHFGGAHLTIATPAADTARSGVVLARQPVIQLTDSNGAALHLAGVPVTVSVAGGGGILHGTKVVETDATGVATFSGLSLVGAGAQTLAFGGSGVPSVLAAPVDLPVALHNGDLLGPLNGGSGSARWYAVDVPAGISELALTTDSGTGNLDLFLRRNGLPTPGLNDCAAQSGTNSEQCVIVDPEAGSWYVLVQGTGPYAGAELTLTLTAPGGCSIVSAGDADGDRLPNCVETNTGTYAGLLSTGTDPNDPDTDHDGLSDGDEVLGTTLGLDLPALGVSPVHRDILLEFDWFDDANECGAHSHRPTPQAIGIFTQAMAQADLPNPDGTPGIHIVADYGQGGAFTGGEQVQDGDGVLTFGVGSPEYLGIKEGHFAVERQGYFHYVILPHRYFTNSNSSGQAELPGDDMIVSLYCAGSDQNVANTIMHELGHNLLLRHGGDVDLNYKPNYNSVMNYLYQFPGVDNDCTPPGNGVLSYSYGARVTLNENGLNESEGICGLPAGVGIDWNDDAVFSTTPSVVADVNRNPSTGAGDGILGVLTDHDDWHSLFYQAVQTGARGAARLLVAQEVISCPAVPEKAPGGR